jgi:TonB family protein
MNGSPANPPAPGLAGPQREGWPRQRWLALIAFVFAAHVVLIFALGQKKAIVPRAATNVPVLTLADDSDELLALNNPALFALPNPKDFASAFWSQLPKVPQPSFRFTEAPRWLPLPAENLGATFQQFMRTNSFAGLPLDFKPEPKFSEPVLPVESAFAQNSSMQIEGELAQRRLLNKINLPSLPDNDILEPSVVQAPVDAAGNVFSVVLLESSGLDAADQRALEIAKTLRFAPAANLTIGQLVFHWRTIPVTTTNDNSNAH